MDREEQVYQDLQRHLNDQPVGYPATRSGAEIRILKRFFTQEEARLALHMTYKPSSLDHIYESVKDGGISLKDVERMLDGMLKKGVIGHHERAGTRYFSTIPFVVGMFEGQLKRLDPEFLIDVQTFTTDRAFGLEFLSTKLPQMRTIPVGKSIAVEHHVTTYDHLVDIIKGAEGPFAIHECMCRKIAAMKGNPCQKTARSETCMALGDMARNFIGNGMAREISREEALDIAARNEADGLVFQPSNTQKVDFVCACCGCCCGMLHIQKMLRKPVDFWATNYYAAVTAENCSGCGTCVERCQVNAVSIDDATGVSSVNLDRCIGCGNCVVSCPSEAMSLLKKEKETVPPTTSEALYDTIMTKKKGKLGKINLAAKLILKT